MKADNLIKFQASSQEHSIKLFPLLFLLPKTHTLLTVCVQCEEVLVKTSEGLRMNRMGWRRDVTLRRTCGQTCSSDTQCQQQSQQWQVSTMLPRSCGKIIYIRFYFLCMPKQIIWTQQMKQEINQSIVAAHSFLKIRIAFIFILLAYLEFQKDWEKNMQFFSCINTNNRKHPIFLFNSLFLILFCFEKHFSLVCTY